MQCDSGQAERRFGRIQLGKSKLGFVGDEVA